MNLGTPDARTRRRILSIVLAALIAPPALFAGPSMRQEWTTWTHTRPLTSGALALLEEATERSAIITTLLEDLERTDIVVYVTDAMSGVGGPTSHLSFLSQEGGMRYLLVRIDFWRLSPIERLAWLGHELEHALEVAEAPKVRDAAGLARLYQRIGWPSGDKKFETARARDVFIRLRGELARRE